MMFGYETYNTYAESVRALLKQEKSTAADLLWVPILFGMEFSIIFSSLLNKKGFTGLIKALEIFKVSKMYCVWQYIAMLFIECHR